MGYAVVRTGGKQYRMIPGDTVRVELLDGEPGATIELADVLLAAADDGGVRVGTPLVDGVKVTAKILEQGRARKILVFHKKRRKNERRRRGHRQHLTTLRVLDILG